MVSGGECAPEPHAPGLTSINLGVDQAAAGRRLDAWLAEALPELSRSRLKALIDAGRVRVDGVGARPSHRLRTGQSVRVDVPEPARAEPLPKTFRCTSSTRMPICSWWTSRPVWWCTPGPGTPMGTLVNALLHRVRDLSGVGGVLRPGIVHRLDKGTSGLLVIAKHDRAHRALAAQFASRSVEKEYLALVLGVPRRREGRIEAPIGRHPVQRKKMAVRPEGRPALSVYRVVEAADAAALVRVRIHTGRTHQIRVHLASLGHPVAGDATYGGTRTPPSRRAAAREALAALERPALHAARLAFTHPTTGRRLEFEAPLPDDLARVLEALRTAGR